MFLILRPHFGKGKRLEWGKLSGFIMLLAILLGGCRPAEFTPTRPALPERTQPAPTQASLTPTLPQPTPVHTPSVIPTSALGVEPERLHGTQVDFWHTWTGAGEQAVKALVEEFNATNEWGIVVVPSASSGYSSLAEKLTGTLDQDGGPDLLVSYAYQNLAGEALVELDGYLEDPTWGLPQEEPGDLFHAFWEGSTTGSRTSLPAPHSAQLLYYNQTWANELGYREPPENTAEFKQQACAAAAAAELDEDPANDGTGGWMISTHYSTVLGWLHAFGADFVRPEGTGYRFNTDEVSQALKYLRELYEDGCAWLSESQVPDSEFASRHALFAPGSLADIPYQLEAFHQAGNGDQWTVLPFPSPQGTPAISVYGPVYQILKSNPEEQLAAWLFLRWLAAPENEARLARALGMFPARQTTLDQLSSDSQLPAQTLAAFQLLPYARLEPTSSSWNAVRWAVSDAATQLFRYYFELKGLPAMVRLLDRTANDLHRNQ